MIPDTRLRPTVCVICPCHNEELLLESFHERLKQVLLTLSGYDHRIHFVDDGSTDRTLEILNTIAADDDRVSVYSLSRNFGHQIALSAGLDTAEGDAVIMMDSDHQHPPELIPEMLNRWRDGFDIVSTIRLQTEGCSIFKRASSWCFYRLMSRFSETPVPANVADFCLLSKRAWFALRAMPERHRFLRGMVSWMGFERTYIKFDAGPRPAGESKYTFRRMWALAMNGMFSFSTIPIKIASRVGAVLVICGSAYMACIVARSLLFDDLVDGWASLICTLLVLGGMQLVFTGLIGEYLARVFEETKQRPLYLLKQQPPRHVETAADAWRQRELTYTD